MPRVIVSTSSSTLDHHNLPDNVRMLRNHIYIGNQHFLDGKDISVSELTTLMNANPDLLPNTTPPKEDEIADLFNQLMNEGYDEILVITISAKLSKCNEHANRVKGLFASHVNIVVFDSQQPAFMEGLMVLEASRMMEANKSLYEIERRLQYMRNNLSVWFMVDDLRNMIKTKRISAPAGFFANLFSIKPLLSVNDKGEIIPIERVRKTDKALERICELTLEKVHNQPNAQIYLMSLGDIDLDEYVKDILADNGFKNIITVPVATVALSNIGTKGVAIGVIIDNAVEKKSLKDVAA